MRRREPEQHERGVRRVRDRAGFPADERVRVQEIACSVGQQDPVRAEREVSVLYQSLQELDSEVDLAGAELVPVPCSGQDLMSAFIAEGAFQREQRVQRLEMDTVTGVIVAGHRPVEVLDREGIPVQVESLSVARRDKERKVLPRDGVFRLTVLCECAVPDAPTLDSFPKSVTCARVHSDSPVESEVEFK